AGLAGRRGRPSGASRDVGTRSLGLGARAERVGNLRLGCRARSAERSEGRCWDSFVGPGGPSGGSRPLATRLPGEVGRAERVEMLGLVRWAYGPERSE